MSSRSRLQKNQTNSSAYGKHLPLAILALLCLAWLLHILFFNAPEEIANFGVHQLYLPFLAPFFLFMTFFSGYLLLNIKRGSVIGLFTTLLVLFRLQQIEFETWWVLTLSLIFAIFVFFTKKTNTQFTHESHKNE